MQVVYVPDQPPRSYSKSIFLAGPSPRPGQPESLNWRPEALATLERLGFDGVVFVPLPENGDWRHGYDSQIGWELQNLDRADQIVFWVPRSAALPALTTNIEYGRFFDSGRAVLGYPEDAPNMRYLALTGKDESVPVAHTLEETLQEAIKRIGNGATRTAGERDVPLNIWRLPHFQGWYRSQTGAGNRLDGAKVLWTFRVGPGKSYTFGFILHVNVFIQAEKRNKINEFVFARPDIATVVGYRRPFRGIAAPRLQDTEIAIIREFRSPARTSDGFIREIPGGSSWKPGDDPFVTMTHELEEETGLGPLSGFTIAPSRLRKVGARQLCGTLSVHQAHVFACELTDREMGFLKQEQANNTAHGVEADTERTYVEVHRLGDLLKADSDLLDWSMLGQILTALS